MSVRFAILKCHGSGNDFPLIDARALTLAEADWAMVARALADRCGPVGGDGLLLLTAGDDDCAFGMVMRNADGSEAETCLNGLRCVARAGFAALAIEAATVRLQTSRAAAVLAEPLAPGVYTVRETAGPASLDIAAWPMDVGAAVIDTSIAALSASRMFTAVAMPNPHLVSFVDRIDEAELVRIGGICESAPDWLPNRANVSFVELRGHDLFVRTFERGVGLTDSCGSAMAASTYAACLTGRIAYDVPTTVFNKGGLVRAEASADGMVSLSGNATYEWAGWVSVDLTTGTASDLVISQTFDAERESWSAAVAALAPETSTSPESGRTRH